MCREPEHCRHILPFYTTQNKMRKTKALLITTVDVNLHL
jgi:hypothetical protein